MQRSPTKTFLAIVAAVLVLATAFAFLASTLLPNSRPKSAPAGLATVTPTVKSEETPESAADELAATAPSPPSQEPVAISGRIAYVTIDGEIATVSAQGEDHRTLTQGGIRYQFPAWSPSGQYVAAIGSRRGGAGLYLLKDQLDAPEPQELYFSRAQSPFYLYWSPDDQKIALLANHSTEQLGLHLVPTGPEQTDLLLATGRPFYWQWTADARQLFIHSGYAGPGARLAFLNAVSGDVTLDVARPGFFQAPGISPSEQYLAYAEEVNEEASQLVILNRETGARQVERHPGQVAFSWSPREELLAVTTEESGAGHFFGPLRLVDAQTGDIRLLTRETVIAFFWSPDGNSIVAMTIDRGAGDVQAALSETGVAPRLSAWEAGELALTRAKPAQQSQFPPLNLILIDVETGSHRLLPSLQASPQFLTQFLPFFDQYALSHRLWSPDSLALIIPTIDDGGEAIMLLPVDGSEPRQIAEGDMPFWSHQ